MGWGPLGNSKAILLDLHGLVAIELVLIIPGKGLSDREEEEEEVQGAQPGRSPDAGREPTTLLNNVGLGCVGVRVC